MVQTKSDHSYRLYMQVLAHMYVYTAVCMVMSMYLMHMPIHAHTCTIHAYTCTYNMHGATVMVNLYCIAGNFKRFKVHDFDCDLA